MNWADGSSYQGYWRDDKANGSGKFTHTNGATYNGTWIDDNADGYGVFIHPE